MDDIIQLNSYPLKTALNILLKDKTTKKNIVWATDSYVQLGEKYSVSNQITVETLTGFDPIMIQPRIKKALKQQQERTRSYAEVFSPAWVCNKMNNYCDEEWFGRKNVFNTEKEKSWETVSDKIVFSEPKTWQQYIDSRRLEITCGEAPFIVSRYDASTGELIDIKNRIGFLDRKLRVVGENTENEDEWLKWVIRAFQSVYGYEYQGDNLLIARINLLMTFVDYYNEKWQREPAVKELKSIANIISWNIWQMDGLKVTTPAPPTEEYEQLTFMELSEPSQENAPQKCRIFDWRKDSSILFEKLRER